MNDRKGAYEFISNELKTFKGKSMRFYRVLTNFLMIYRGEQPIRNARFTS